MSNTTPLDAAAAGHQPRRRRSCRVGAAVLACLVCLVAAVVVAIALGGGRRKRAQGLPPPTTPLAEVAAAAGTAVAPEPVAPQQPTPGFVASAAAEPSSDVVGAQKAQAAALPPSTQDALGKLAAAAAAVATTTSAGSKQQQQPQQQGHGSGTCRVQTAEELTDAVEGGPCDLIQLTNSDRTAYVLSREVNVTRRVTVVGHPAYLPTIDAGGGGAVRAFHVLAGGFLDLRFVRVRQGAGITRDRYGSEGADLPSKVVEVRGGAVAIELGALGGSFTGVTFIAAYNTPESVASAIAATMQGTGGRTYGGHVFVMEGEVTFVGCNFWDTSLVVPLTDQFVMGGDVLLVGGRMSMTACTFTVSTVFSNVGGVGGCVAVLGGILSITWSFEQAQSVFSSNNGPGQTFWCGGGVMIMTGFDFRLVVAALSFTGFGDFSVGGGVLVMTGVTITNAYGLLFAAGAGFYVSVGAGVLVQTGVTYTQFSGPAFDALAGGSIFVGTGASINTGCPASFSASTFLFTGIGAFAYNGAGVSTWVGCPFASFTGLFAFYGAGEVTAHSAGWLTWVGCPVFAPVAILHFVGLGGVLYVGTGGAIVANSPVYAPIALSSFQGNGANFVVGQQSWTKGKGATYAGGKTLVSSNTNANVSSRRALRHGPRARAGKRYLKGQPRVPYPWLAFEDGEADGGEGGARILMSGTRSFDHIDLGDPVQRQGLAGWVPEPTLTAAQAVQSLRTDVQDALMLDGNASSSPSSSSLSTPPPGVRRHVQHNRRHRHRRRQQQQQEQRQARSSQQRPTLYVGEDVTYCGACDVDSVDGPAAGQCETDCAALEERAQLPTASLNFDFGSLQFEPAHLIFTTIETAVPVPASASSSTSSDDSSAAVAALAMDVRDALRRWLRSPAVDLPDVQVAVYAASPQDGGHDELVRRWRGEKEEVSAFLAPCSVRPLRLAAVFVAHDAEAAALLQQAATAAAAPAEEEEGQQDGAGTAAPSSSAAARESLLGAVRGALPPPVDTPAAAAAAMKGCARDGEGAADMTTTATPSVSFDRALFVPAYDSPELLKEQQQQSPTAPNSNSIRLVDPLRPGVPLGATGMGGQQSLVRGRSYLLELTGFPPRSSVQVALAPVPSASASASASVFDQKEQQQPEPRPLMALQTDDRGIARTLWAVPRSLALGTYYLQAARGEGEGEGELATWWLSPLYTVAARPARRRLFGPVLEF